MSAKQYSIAFLSFTLVLIVAVLAGALPIGQIDLVSGQRYGGYNRPRRPPTRIPPSVTPPPTATVDAYNPFIGSESVAPAPLRVPEGTQVTITEDALIHWTPEENTSTGLFVRSGQQFSVSGVDESGEWVRISFQGEAAWVRRRQTSLPAVRVQEATPTPAASPTVTLAPGG